MHVVGTLFVFNFYVCFGARFFDADVRRCVRMSDIDSTSATEPTSTIAGGLMIKLHDNSTILLDVGAAHRDVVLGMLRLYVAQAAAAEAIPAPRFARVALWRGADGSYSRLEDPASAEERPLQMSESDWERVYTHCAQTVHCKSLSVVVRQGVADPASFERCYSIGRGAVSLERTSEDGSGVTRFATLGTDATFNEMALVCPNMGSPSVNVVALEDTVLYAIDNVALQRELVEMRSEALADEAAMFELRLMRYIAGRLRDALVHGRRVCTMHPCHMTEM
jgi:CRP-like cAMP-binding protein